MTPLRALRAGMPILLKIAAALAVVAVMGIAAAQFICSRRTTAHSRRRSAGTKS